MYLPVLISAVAVVVVVVAVVVAVVVGRSRALGDRLGSGEPGAPSYYLPIL